MARKKRYTSGRKRGWVRARTRSARQPDWAALLRRLRRLELALVSLLRPELVKGLDLDLAGMVEDIRARRRDEGEEVQVLPRRPRQGQSERDYGADGGPESSPDGIPYEDAPWGEEDEG